MEFDQIIRLVMIIFAGGALFLFYKFYIPANNFHYYRRYSIVVSLFYITYSFILFLTVISIPFTVLFILFIVLQLALFLNSKVRDIRSIKTGEKLIDEVIIPIDLQLVYILNELSQKGTKIQHHEMEALLQKGLDYALHELEKFLILEVSKTEEKSHDISIFLTKDDGHFKVLAHLGLSATTIEIIEKKFRFKDPVCSLAGYSANKKERICVPDLEKIDETLKPYWVNLTDESKMEGFIVCYPMFRGVGDDKLVQGIINISSPNTEEFDSDLIIRILGRLAHKLESFIYCLEIYESLYESSISPERSSPQYKSDIVFITTLEEEMEALLSKFDELTEMTPFDDDIRTYYQARLPFSYPNGSNGTYTITIMQLLGMGRLQAAMATMDAIRKWHPLYVFLIGIAGGVASKRISLGDILIADQIIDYELQKITSEGPQIRWEVHKADPRMLGAITRLKSKNWIQLSSEPRPGSGEPKRHIGPIASGDKVIAFREIMEKYQKDWPKLLGVEMEASGVAAAVLQSPEKPGFFMIKGVSDYADENKGSEEVEKWRRYACDIAASYAIAFLSRGPFPLKEGRN